jgi:hypothetical protein
MGVDYHWHGSLRGADLGLGDPACRCSSDSGHASSNGATSAQRISRTRFDWLISCRPVRIGSPKTLVENNRSPTAIVGEMAAIATTSARVNECYRDITTAILKQPAGAGGYPPVTKRAIFAGLRGGRFLPSYGSSLESDGSTPVTPSPKWSCPRAVNPLVLLVR